MHNDLPRQNCLPLVFDQVAFSVKDKALVQQLNVSIHCTGISAIMGPNGAGKSLMLRMLGGLLEPSKGHIQYGQLSGIPRGRIGYVFQSPVLLRRSVIANLKHALKLAGVSRPLRQSKAQWLLQEGGLSSLKDSPARSLSGGEKQRLALLRALACSPELLLLDEPTASLDPQATSLIENLIRQVSAQGVKVVLISHDQGQVRRLADEVIFIHQGKVVEHQPVDAFLNSPQSRQAQGYLKGQLLLD